MGGSHLWWGLTNVIRFNGISHLGQITPLNGLYTCSASNVGGQVSSEISPRQCITRIWSSIIQKIKKSLSLIESGELREGQKVQEKRNRESKYSFTHVPVHHPAANLELVEL